MLNHPPKQTFKHKGWIVLYLTVVFYVGIMCTYFENCTKITNVKFSWSSQTFEKYWDNLILFLYIYTIYWICILKNEPLFLGFLNSKLFFKHLFVCLRVFPDLGLICVLCSRRGCFLWYSQTCVPWFLGSGLEMQDSFIRRVRNDDNRMHRPLNDSVNAADDNGILQPGGRPNSH